MRRLFAALSLLILLTACGGDGATDPGASIAGTYTLRTVNGSPLPFIVQQAGSFKYEITGGSYTLADNGTWTERRDDRTTSNGAVTTNVFTDAGTYMRNGAAITFVSTGSGAMSGSVSDGTLSLSANGSVRVYTR